MHSNNKRLICASLYFIIYFKLKFHSRVPIEIPRPYPVFKTKEVKVEIERPVYVKTPVPIKVPVPVPYSVEVPQAVKVSVPQQVILKEPKVFSPSGMFKELLKTIY